MNQYQKIGYSGAAILALGVFTPILSAPIIGSVTYFNNGKGDGVILLILAIAGALLIYQNQPKITLALGLVSVLIVTYSSWNVMNVINDAKHQMESELEGNPFAGLATGLFGTIQMQWGWVFLYVGSIALALSGYLIIKAEKISVINNEEDAPNEN